MFCIFLVALVDCGDESKGSGVYHTVDVLLGVEEFSSILEGELLTACSDSCGMLENAFGCTGGDQWVWILSQMEGGDELGRG